MKNNNLYKSRLREKGQITLPNKIRSLLKAKEGDELLFYQDQTGKVVVDRAQMVPPDQAWFWSQRWQKMEREIQSDIDQNRIVQYKNVDEFIAYLNRENA
jgi:AbrB family looped-hinge helix DNA binding protein